MKRIYFLPLALLLLQCQSAETPLAINKFDDLRLRELYDLQDQRQSQDLIPFLAHPDSIMREAAALAFSSLQDPMAKEPLVLLLGDPVASVRNTAAYALGQLSDTTLQQPLMHAIDQETKIEVVNSLLEALGKCSTVNTGLTFLTDLNQVPNHNHMGTAWGIYRAGLKGIHSPAALMRMMDLLESEQWEARLGAAHFLARTQGLDLSEYGNQLTQASKDSLPEIRMALALALGKAGSAVKEHLLYLLRNDEDYRVRVNAIRALGNLLMDPWELLPALQDESEHVVFTAANFLRDFGTSTMSDTLKILAGEAKDVQVSTALYGVCLAHAQQDSELVDYLQLQFKEEKNPYHQAFYVDALSRQVGSYAFLENVVFGDYPPAVTTAAINGLYEINKNPEFPLTLKDQFAAIYRQSVATGDVATAGIAAQALRDEALKFKGAFDDLGFLDIALENLTLPRDIETYQELLRTKNYLLDIDNPVEAELAYNNPIDWELVAKIPSRQRIRIATIKGDIQMELMVDESPATVAYIWKLMDGGFYDNKTFHRVVPNFVAQGGCPRGDGWGSTEHTIRSELGTSKYLTGTVGMASAGKDTESCQWFITHSPTPHLDGRYTVFARVVSGMDVVHQLEVGDQIIKIEKY